MSALREVLVPDIGDFDAVDVIEVLVRPGDRVALEQSLITLESEKATMEIPSPAAGVVRELHVAVGDKVSQGARIATLEVEEGAREAAPAPKAAAPAPAPAAAAAPAAGAPAPAPREPAPARPVAAPAPAPVPAPPAPAPGASLQRAHASPSVRRLARELGVELGRVRGSGRKARILKEDVQGFVRTALAATAPPPPAAGPAFGLPPAPQVDFSKWGEIEVRPLSKVRRVSARNLHRSWLTVAHVTQFDEADITDLETFRRSKADEARERGAKLTLLAFLMKAVAVVLEDFPSFNSSLEPGGEAIVVKKYFHLGFAVDTENGLVVPVIRDVDRKGLLDLAVELAALSQRARDRKLGPEDMAGGTFTISSLGGIGGTMFTPIVNHPEVAILGVSRAETRPVWQGRKFVPRLLLPLSLSYDHRVIDGADAVRFTTRLRGVLADIRNLAL